MKTTNHLSVRVEPAPTNDTGRTVGNRTTQNKQTTDRNFTASDPLKGWHALGKNAKRQPVKRTWTHGKQRGRVDAYLAAHVALLLVIGWLIFGGLIYV